MEKSKVIIFYSWQSDLSKDTNQNGIRLSIKSAIPLVELDFEDLDLIPDEATRNVSGSPDITKEIFKKISSSDIFICDLTPIAETGSKKIANPNVLIELGYAIAELGWERIILLFNSHFGKIPDDLPFDVAKHRATSFKIVDKSDKNGKKELTTVLTNAIKLIIEKNPKRPHQEKDVNPEEKKRNLDIENINWILSSIHIPTFDEFLDEVPDYMLGNIFYYFEGYKSIFRSNAFHIYDERILNLLKNIYDNWSLLLSFGHRYDNAGGQNVYKFFFPNNTVDAENARNEMHMLFEKKVDLTENFKGLLNNIRTNYLEIDLKETSKIAFEDYLSYQSDYEK